VRERSERLSWKSGRVVRRERETRRSDNLESLLSVFGKWEEALGPREVLGTFGESFGVLKECCKFA
jgi:hypothetical protein